MELEIFFEKNAVLPPLGGWTILPDFACLMLQHIEQFKPQNIVELGSGASTVLLGLMKQRHDFIKRVVALEHEENYLEKTSEALVHSNVKDLVELYHAPLKPVYTKKGEFKWYDVTLIPMPATIDLLVVDGPPGYIQRHSRYPALELLAPHMGPKTHVLLDDTKRQDEQEIMAMWQQLFPDMCIQQHPCEKGAALLAM